MSPVLLIAVDHGARAALEPLAARAPFQMVDFDPVTGAQESYWTALFRSAGARLAVAGTSDSRPGRGIESAARRAAARRSLPMIAIEDYPGNYSHVPDAVTRLLVVESESVRAFHRERLAAACPEIVVCPPARYDVYRERLSWLRAGTLEKWASAGNSPAVLWAGQPETDDAVVTLEQIIPQLKSRRVEFLFKAHPRDAGHGAGVYARLFAQARLDFRDVTSLSVPDALALAPMLVLTQFSSVAIEAGFFGIPSLHVLLANAGGARLRQKKGYDIPPFCLAGAAACVSDVKTLAATFSNALLERPFRERLVTCFDEYFNAREPTLPRLIDSVSALAAGTQNPP